jgi:uncharacterized protein YijF (DUF1287 family)
VTARRTPLPGTLDGSTAPLTSEQVDVMHRKMDALVGALKRITERAPAAVSDLGTGEVVSRRLAAGALEQVHGIAEQALWELAQ